ncbi:MAG: hypothetical protein QME85_01535 [Candidatus Saccharicenans sp.]|nr:hypothetical protein [Candidatus Saccharicenans sp.]
MAGEYGVNPNQVRERKEKLVRMLPDIFSDRRKREVIEREELEAELFLQIGQLRVENEWLKKNFSNFIRREEAAGGREQGGDICVPAVDLLELPRSSYYYRSAGEGDYNLYLIRLIQSARSQRLSDDG